MIISKVLTDWDEMYNVARPSMKSKRDLITTFLHWNILKRKISCLEVDYEKSQFDGEIGSDLLLPADWNKDEKYMLKYKHGDEIYILIGFESNGTALFNFLVLQRTSDVEVYNLVVNIEDSVRSLDGTIEEMIPDYENLMQKIKTNILHRIINKKIICVGTQTQDLELLVKSNRRPSSPDTDSNSEHVAQNKIDHKTHISTNFGLFGTRCNDKKIEVPFFPTKNRRLRKEMS